MTLMSIPDICPSLAHKTAGCGHRNVRTSLPLLWLYHTRERSAPASDVAQAWKGAALSATPDRVAEFRGRGERRGSTGLNRFHRIGFHDYGQFHSWGYIAGLWCRVCVTHAAGEKARLPPLLFPVVPQSLVGLRPGRVPHCSLT